MPNSSPNIALETSEAEKPAADKWESEDEFEARLQRIQSSVTATDSKADLGDMSEEVVSLRGENAKLKQLVEEARRRVTQLETESEKNQKRDQEIDRMLEEKSDQIRELEKQVEEFKARQTSGVTEEELLALHSELERERKTLEEDRLAMEEQFRHLELGMSRERAEIARERAELSRTKNEMKHKLELIEKTAQTELSPLQRLREELIPDQGPAQQGVLRHGAPNLPAMPNLPAINRKAPEGDVHSRRSGLISRFLGKKDK